MQKRESRCAFLHIPFFSTFFCSHPFVLSLQTSTHFFARLHTSTYLYIPLHTSTHLYKPLHTSTHINTKRSTDTNLLVLLCVLCLRFRQLVVVLCSPFTVFFLCVYIFFSRFLLFGVSDLSTLLVGRRGLGWQWGTLTWSPALVVAE